MTASWANRASIYHLYPLGALGAPARNSFHEPVSHRLQALHGWLDYLQDLGVDTLLLGPVFQASSHGYDTADYFRVDTRLGSEETLAALSADLHGRNMRLVLDGVFHHTGRDFHAFRDLLAHGAGSRFRDWYHLDFSSRSPYQDPFHYEGWAGHYDLVKLNLRHPAVREHLLGAVSWWIERFEIDGLRLDAADKLEPDFRVELAQHCRRLKPEFWLLGEVVHGDYRGWVHPDGLDATTNYELYKGLWSSHNDHNYFELAHSLNRQFGEHGLYRGLCLYSFADNHDVDRIASTLAEPAHLYPLYLLLTTMPGVPSIYYGSEWGLPGRRTATSDTALRPQTDPAAMQAQGVSRDLHGFIRRLLGIRRHHVALQTGGYAQLLVSHEQLAFVRGYGAEALGVVVNSAAHPANLDLEVPGLMGGSLEDVLNEGERFAITNGRCRIGVPPHWGRILKLAV